MLKIVLFLYNQESNMLYAIYEFGNVLLKSTNNMKIIRCAMIVVKLH